MNKNDKKEDLNLPDLTIANILQTGNWMNETFSDHLKQFALSIQQYQVLRSLKKLNGQPADLQSLQAEMVSKNSNTTRLVEKLRLKGLITRFQNEENRRKVEIRITEQGIELLAEIEKIQDQFETAVVGNLTEKEILILNKLLIKIRNKN
ncbi:MULTISPECIES: MarR family winged helix-turn-helix transcriptional regulator [Flavobacteriaceae]|uniref:MarR family transcriptional regulator n=2 Tax=Flavobacteriaceae TaxID=49546 RepID=A0A4Y8AVZ2_9FLAO|nr:MULTISPECIES: MarR family transcriptional regulator [Flavobacteriaceae]TEW76716.1 MarR family transcriptional regulator [Gramella jeungdoensis]GGK50661.1 MarR family transcriptional regulator [Lutibacter litoralis]